MAKHVGVVVALLVTLLGGWIWGASGRCELDGALQAALVHSDLLEARTALLAARVALYEAEFSDLRRHLEDARLFVGRAGERIENLGWNDDLQLLDLADFGAQIDGAERLGSRLDRGAPARASESATWPAPGPPFLTGSRNQP